MGKKILVTGAGGFIGYHLSNHLADSGNNVIGIDLQYPKDANRDRHIRFRAVVGDFQNQEIITEFISEVDVVFHLASAHLDFHLPDSEFWSTNVHSLSSLMETAYQNCVKRFVHVSSVGVYGNIKKWPADEEAPCKPQNIYGETKLAGELAVKKYRDDTGLPVVILRPAWVYGPGCPRTLKIYRALRRGHFIMIGKGDNLRHPLYIQDMLSAFIRAMEADSAVGETFIVGGRHAFSTAELINSFCNVFDLSRPKIRLPMILGKIAVSGVELIFNLAGKNPPVSKRSLEFFQANNSFDIGKAKKILNFSPKFSFEDGLRETRNWLESHDSS